MQGVLQAWKLLEKMRRLFRVVSLESSYQKTTTDECLLVSHWPLALLDYSTVRGRTRACALLATRLTQEVTALYQSNRRGSKRAHVTS